MKIKNIFSGIVFALFIATFSGGCLRDAIGIYGSGNNVTQTRSLNSFTGIDLSIDANVILHVTPAYHIELHGQQNILNVLTTEIHGSVLKLEFSHRVHSHSPITLDVYAPSYSTVNISGSGTIQNMSGWNCPSFETKISGSGNISIAGLQTGNVESEISGSGTISLDGTCTSLSSSISGSGNLQAFNLAGNTGDVNVSGSGKSELNLTQSIDIHISGSGDVYYKNNPALNVNISGSGHLIHVQ